MNTIKIQEIDSNREWVMWAQNVDSALDRLVRHGVGFNLDNLVIIEQQGMMTLDFVDRMNQI